MADTIVLLICAVVWWIPAFMALSDLQQRDGLPRKLVWKWTGVLCVPVIGPAVYFRRGRPTLDARRDTRRSRR